MANLNREACRFCKQYCLVANVDFHALSSLRHCAVVLLYGSVYMRVHPRTTPNRQRKTHYNAAIQRTFQQEMLLNIVRLKYREVPEFLTVGGIAAQYSFDSSAAAGLTIPEGVLDIFSLNSSVSRSEKPTISYVPAGEEFQKGLLAPIDPESLQLLCRTGWSWERILRTTVQYLNEVNNATSAGGPTPDLKPEF
tara:strand:- start:106 stop:687 length:582 start_codon:yes stop_codon:yes gene_type:complete